MATSSTATTPPPTSSNYGDCVASLRTSLNFLESSVHTLESGVSDFPRLMSVLKTVRHYELIPQPTLAAAEASLRDEIGPFIALLLDRAESQLERQARRIETLKARAELNAGRLSQGGPSSSPPPAPRSRPSSSAARRLGGEAALRARAVRQRKEALRYGVERLELEVAQKERELRVRLEKA
ncbi:DASH complex subunit spc19 [Pleurostoma richardsiae]|uniref:DASH complex subunit SPC19 n=1 Tax=Pleurostoma richardsiae TaxID=41990 RepID=A0AA38RQG9_9PEZI|nr:DASH complex subunit spc19 [Pleurostoma richardsiae]